MTDLHSPPRPATLKDLQAIPTRAANHPAERQKLADAPEDALRQAGLMATPDAVEFLRSLGQAKFNEGAQVARPAKNEPHGGGMGEM